MQFSTKDAQKLRRLFSDLKSRSRQARSDFVTDLTLDEVESLLYEWSAWGRSDQLLPEGDWVYWLILAGRGAGKTRSGAEAVRAWVRRYDLVNMIGATRQDARDIMVLGESGILAVCPTAERPYYARASDRLVWPNGSISQIFSAEEPDRLRGKQHKKLWIDELAAWRDPDAFDQAMFGLRLGDSPQAVITTTPRPTRLIKQLLSDRNAIVTRGTTFDNANFLAPAFLKQITSRFEGRMVGLQEIYAEIVEEAPGALWTRALLERQRLSPQSSAVSYSQIAIGVDPPARSGAKADECGIVVVGRTERGLIHVLADLSSQGETPGQWSKRVASAFHSFSANRIVAEINNGGEMVTEVLRQHDPNLPVRTVTATRGKFLRAEPVAACYERGIVFHIGNFAKLEDQLCSLTPDYDSRVSGSPDRADALVWAIADLIASQSRQAQTLLDYYAKESKAP